MIVSACLLAAVLLAIGLPPMVVSAMSVSIVWPPAAFIAACGYGIWVLIRRRGARKDDSEAAFLRSVAAAVSSGATPRQALLDSTIGAVDGPIRRLCRLGRPMAEVAAAVRPRLPRTGHELAVLLSLSEDVGSGITVALDQLADHAAAGEEIEREQSVAVAQARFSAVVVGIVPMIAAVAILAVRGIPEPGGAIVIVPMVVGWGLMAIGAAAVFGMSARVVRS